MEIISATEAQNIMPSLEDSLIVSREVLRQANESLLESKNGWRHDYNQESKDNFTAIAQDLEVLFSKLNAQVCIKDAEGRLSETERTAYEGFRDAFKTVYVRVIKFKKGIQNFESGYLAVAAAQ